MPSVLNMMKACSESRHHSDWGETINTSTHQKKKQSRRYRSVELSSHSAACRGLYATPTRRSTHKQRRQTCSAHFEKSGPASAESEGDDLNDPIIKFSMYPQMIGKRRSELETQVRTRSTKYNRTSTEAHRREDTTRVGRPVRRQQPSSCDRSRSVESDFSFSSGYSSDGNPEGRPVRVCIYPQAKYIKEPVKTPLVPQRTPVVPFKASSEEPSTWTPSSHAFKRSRLPDDEYQMLVRRQKIQRAREVLEPHYAHHSSIRDGRIWHGMMQGFTIRNSERRRISKVQYAVRKALQADLDLLDDEFRLALNHHADKVYFCELSDVDGLPIDERMVHEFIRLYQEAQDAAYVLKLPGLSCGEPTRRPWADEGNERTRQAAFQRTDSDVAEPAPVKQPGLVSKFSWDSNDDELETRKWLTKPKR